MSSIVIGIFPNPESVIRLIGALLIEINDDMTAFDRRYMAAGTFASRINNLTLASRPAAPRLQPIGYPYAMTRDIIGHDRDIGLCLAKG